MNRSELPVISSGASRGGLALGIRAREIPPVISLDDSVRKTCFGLLTALSEHRRLSMYLEVKSCHT